MYNKLPQDIIKYIYEFSPEHRENYIESIKRIQIYKQLELIPHFGSLTRYRNLLNIFDRQINNYGIWDFESVILKYINDPEHFIKTLSKCKCCKRHNCRKPKHLQDYDYLDNMILQFSYTDCKCPCRHASRFIFKAFNNQLDESVPFSKKWYINIENNIENKEMF